MDRVCFGRIGHWLWQGHVNPTLPPVQTLGFDFFCPGDLDMEYWPSCEKRFKGDPHAQGPARTGPVMVVLDTAPEEEPPLF